MLCILAHVFLKWIGHRISGQRGVKNMSHINMCREYGMRSFLSVFNAWKNWMSTNKLISAKKEIFFFLQLGNDAVTGIHGCKYMCVIDDNKGWGYCILRWWMIYWKCFDLKEHCFVHTLTWNKRSIKYWMIFSITKWHNNETASVTDDLLIP